MMKPTGKDKPKVTAAATAARKVATSTTGKDSPRHFLDLDQIPAAVLREIITLAKTLKQAKPAKLKPAEGMSLAMIFDKPSTRTRVSFDMAMRQLGGETLVLNKGEMQLGRGETIADTARVLSRYVDVMMLRTDAHRNLLELAEYATVPVINGLTDDSHPCQILADILTIEEHRGDIADQTIAWIGDGNNVAASFIHAAVQFGFRLRLACPPELPPKPELLQWAEQRGGDVSLTTLPDEAAAGADVLVTDTWISMGDKNPKQRMQWLKPYQVNQQLMDKAAKDALFLHCLPAHRGEEVTAEVIDGPQSVVFDEAENRLHVQKAILLWCLDLQYPDV